MGLGRGSSHKVDRVNRLALSRRAIAAVALLVVLVVIGCVVVLVAMGNQSRDRVSLRPPELVEPQVIRVDDNNRDLRLDPNRDYRVEMSGVLRHRDGLVISGGRNVVLIGGEIAPSNSVAEGLDETAVLRGLYLRDQTGTIHIEGLRITGEELEEGINLSQTTGATVQLANIAVDTVHGNKEGSHADVLQVWAGPKTLKVDRLAGRSQYQGLFLLPFQHLEDAQLSDWSLRRVRIDLDGEAGYGLWKEGEFSIRLDDVSVQRDGDQTSGGLTAETNKQLKMVWPEVSDWPGLGFKLDSVLTGNPGLNYKSPGYE